MDINARTLADLFTGFNVLFNKSIAETTTNWEKIATLVPSETGEEVYPWLSALPRMREWIGDRVIKKLATEGYSIKNKSYESTIA
ncbi:MAG: Mu-like prophage major head subunit gpT family protein, partial [Angelakisella sp.]